ncbi:MAG: glutamine amidotransferase-related protein, partial [Solirubrobacteraceae bacterium]
MRIGVLETGSPPEALAPRFGDYPAMFRALLGEGFDWLACDVQHGPAPGRPEDADAWIVTGSSAGVYDGEPWIGRLMEFLRAARGRSRLIGVCFGHQAMAESFGGKVIKSPRGWGVGLH